MIFLFSYLIFLLLYITRYSIFGAPASADRSNHTLSSSLLLATTDSNMGPPQRASLCLLATDIFWILSSIAFQWLLQVGYVTREVPVVLIPLVLRHSLHKVEYFRDIFLGIAIVGQHPIYQCSPVLNQEDDIIHCVGSWVWSQDQLPHFQIVFDEVMLCDLKKIYKDGNLLVLSSVLLRLFYYLGTVGLV